MLPDRQIDNCSDPLRLMNMKRMALLLLGTLGMACAADWPQWMGEQRDGVWREAGVRKEEKDDST